MARRTSLREFQQGLVRRLNEAQAATDVPLTRLGVQVGAQHWLVKLDEAGEVIPLPKVASVPRARAWYRGLANIRGNLYSVVDLAAFQGGEITQQTPDARLLLVGERFGMNAALLVNRMLGLRNLKQFQLSEKESRRAWEGARYVDGDGREWRELSMGALVYHPEFLQSGQ
jgi:twitching motility protein PilI